ncbi:MAG: YegS/Rv2252/BmrU family lipid kinase [Cloacibacterium normanense]
MQNVAFIINPFSAKKNYQPFLNSLQAKVENPLYLISKSIQDTEDFIKENFEIVDIFVAIGGDGTISTVAKNLIHTDKILGIFPAGSGNGFSNETKFSKNLDELLAKIQKKNFKEIDTFTVNDRFSINVAGVGFDGAVVEAFEKTSRGFKNYIKTSIQTYFKYKPIKITFEEKYKKYNGKYLMMNIANTRQFGNNAYIAPHASKSDGLLEIALVKKFPFTHAATFAYRMFTKKLVENQYLKYISVSEIEFTVNSNLWHLDGEFNNIESPVKVKVLPKSLRILI